MTEGTEVGGAAGTTDDPETLRRVQLIELETLGEFRRICDQLSLRWFVIGGTLLGAARHEGFIPWDDDIDVGMPRADYDRFEAHCAGLLDSRFAWQSLRTSPAYPYIFGKLMREDTHVVEHALSRLPIRHALGIDVFPLDGAPESGLGRRLHAIAFKLATVTLAARIERTGARRILAYAFRVVPRSGATRLVRRLARRFPYDTSAWAVNAGGAWGYRRECQPRGRFGTPVSLAFEGTTVPAPAEWHEYLSNVYGDYMQLPPPEARRPRHRLTVVGLGDEPPADG